MLIKEHGRITLPPLQNYFYAPQICKWANNSATAKWLMIEKGRDPSSKYKIDTELF